MIYRIKQISENRFIPQVGSFLEYLLGNMEGISNKTFYNTNTWYTQEYQERYCAVGSLEEAKEIIKKHKEAIKENGKYPKYYKV